MFDAPIEWELDMFDSEDESAALSVVAGVLDLPGRALMDGPMPFRRPYARRAFIRSRQAANPVHRVQKTVEVRPALESARIIHLRLR